MPGGGAPGGALGPEKGPGRPKGDFCIPNVRLGVSFWGQNEAKSAQKCTQKSSQKTTLGVFWKAYWVKSGLGATSDRFFCGMRDSEMIDDGD